MFYNIDLIFQKMCQWTISFFSVFLLWWVDIIIIFWNLCYPASKSCKDDKIYVFRSNNWENDVRQILAKLLENIVKEFSEVIEWKVVP